MHRLFSAIAKGVQVRLLLASGVLLIVLALVFVALLAGSAGMSEARGAQMRAEQIWYAQPLDHYRLVIQHRTRTGTCEQDLEIRDDRVQTVYLNQCAQPPSWTVTRLFEWVKQLGRTASLCYPSSMQCTCRVSTFTQVMFDPQMGYPRHIRYEWTLRPNWENLHYWQSLVFNSDRVDCARRTRGGGAVELTVVSLTSLP